jgi:hypothetical protein
MCIAELQRVAKQLGHTPTHREFNEHGSMGNASVTRRFGTWNKALKAAGLEPNKIDKVTKTQALAELKRVAKQLGHTPTAAEFRNHGSMCADPFTTLFGSWNKALKATGLKIVFNPTAITTIQVLAELKRMAKQLNRTPTYTEFIEHGAMSTPVVEQLFGTWNKALSAAGLKINENKTAITKIQALTELKCVAKHLGHTPTGKEFNEHGSMHRATVEKLFGTWNKALDAAGLKRTKSHGHTKTQALAELKRVAKQLKHTPTRNEFDKLGSMVGETVGRLFGSWNKALMAAGLQLNKK